MSSKLELAKYRLDSGRIRASGFMVRARTLIRIQSKSRGVRIDLAAFGQTQSGRMIKGLTARAVGAGNIS